MACSKRLSRTSVFERLMKMLSISGASVTAAVSRSDQLLSEPDAVRFVTTLPRQGGATPRPAVAPPEDDDGRPEPTHLLYGAVAYQISDAPLEVGIAPPADRSAEELCAC